MDDFDEGPYRLSLKAYHALCDLHPVKYWSDRVISWKHTRPHHARELEEAGLIRIRWWSEGSSGRKLLGFRYNAKVGSMRITKKGRTVLEEMERESVRNVIYVLAMKNSRKRQGIQV